MRTVSSESSNCGNERRRLLTDIVTAFPSSRRTVSRIAWGSPENSAEYRYAEDFFAKKRWNEISVDQVIQYPSGPSAAVTFLEDAAFLYYLPLFMTVILQAYEKSDLLVDSLIGELMPESEQVVNGRLGERFESLTREQRSCIASFLKYLADCEALSFVEVDGEIPPQRALRLYWDQYAL